LILPRPQQHAQRQTYPLEENALLKGNPSLALAHRRNRWDAWTRALVQDLPLRMQDLQTLSQSQKRLQPTSIRGILIPDGLWRLG
jgi:hypothetical protein